MTTYADLASAYLDDPGPETLAPLRSIRSTGDGSEQHPWSVLRINDEYDMLRALDKVRDRQGLVETDGRRLDRLTCTDGTVAYSDVSSCAGPISQKDR